MALHIRNQIMRRSPEIDSAQLDTILRLIGGVYFAVCDGCVDAAKAVESLRRFADINADNRNCFTLCHSLADAQEHELRDRNYDFRKHLRPVGGDECD
jgi:hypothetical protein